jgi:putative transposase
VERWRQAERAGVVHQRQKPGPSPRLSTRQLRHLEQALKQGAYAHGYAEDYWTLDRIGHVIWMLFGVRYHHSGVWYVLRRMGWSSQLPQRRALSRDDVAVAHWRRYHWPQVKKVA